MNKQVKSYIQENKEIINAAQWDKLLDPIKVQDALYPDEIEELVHILQRVGMPKDIGEIFPGFTHYEDYDKYNGILKELEVSFTLSDVKEVNDITSALLHSKYNIRDVLDDKPGFGVKHISICSDSDMSTVLVILYNINYNDAVYVTVEDDVFHNNIIQIPGLGIAYNKYKILDNFRKYKDIIIK